MAQVSKSTQRLRTFLIVLAIGVAVLYVGRKVYNEYAAARAGYCQEQWLRGNGSACSD